MSLDIWHCDQECGSINLLHLRFLGRTLSSVKNGVYFRNSLTFQKKESRPSSKQMAVEAAA